MNAFLNWVEQNSDRIQREYFEFLRYKSIGTDPAFKNDTIACAHWAKDYLSRAGLKTELIETVGFPIVWGEDMRAGPDAHCLLIYGHYDVQPVDPIELWQSPPFEPEIRGGQVYARGALDDKGQIFYGMTAALAFKELGEKLPINLKFCIEGEEEAGSRGLSHSLPRLKEKMKADSILAIDFDLFGAGEPAISLGARGIVTLEIALTGSKIDLHSGQFGGLAYNPNRALVELLAKLWDRNGKVQVPGFYDDVEEMSEEEKKLFSFWGDQKEYGKMFGIHAFSMENGCSMMEANWFRPTLEINGICGGYTGPGFKTVIPAQAIAKLSCRLVPKQDPERIGRLIEQFLKSHVEPGMELKVDLHGGEGSFRGRPDSDLAQAVAAAYTDVMGKPCRRILAGGSIPVIAKMEKEIGADIVGMGFGLPDDNIHAPNEHFDMKRLHMGILTVAQTIQRLG
ncbi:MAG: dipeptidase [Verrucomicrobia bacterium]|nr:dipeptidase [Verrucomicrobiota bacterium]